MVDESPRQDTSPPRITRRTLLTTGAATTLLGAGLGAGGVALLGTPGRAPSLWSQPTRSGAQPVGGLHLQFGRDASSEVVVSWHTTDAVSNPRVMAGTSTGGFGRTVTAETRTYRDAKSKTEVRVHHARLDNLAPDTDYVYAAVHDGTNPELGTVRTAPSGRSPLRFTSFGDQATPTLGRLNKKSYVSDNLGSPAAGDITTAIEKLGPLFNLVNGDLCYANLAHDRIRTWSDWFDNNTRSARYRPWMPAAGNHENELGNGPIGFAAYQTYFALPDSRSDGELRGLWYSFTAGSVRIISLNNDDICYQDGGNTYVHGYSGGAQKRWLETELASARADKRVDWVIVCMHQTAVSTADHTNGADLGIRQEWLPLFDRYQVDLVVCGHEHHYERTHPLRGTQDTEARTPIPVSDHGDVIDTTKGTVHVVIGGGGTSSPSNGLFFPEPRCRVVTGLGSDLDSIGRKKPVYVVEDAPWSAFRDGEHPYGFVAFDVDPGSPGGNTTIKATHYAVTGPYGAISEVEHFTLTRPRGG
ncbi:fibronectin type III domain-containing protein [Candidatus Mycobacterium wuenschmannii]|uniref:Fibronectin type III domain-containing protein n=1 Tax=Candidatus Mycobacterium wuenschmannii TaxID=3027808 RepID=A0ABY8W286_9MYCO|nr:fibronectin type III domain-containing protein [Candidatus Mycobacterium wuenschmannii]WIM88538.1 fibronectin type III domain-containing protein [Candidatus Mycobacterium wuenschmannii]